MKLSDAERERQRIQAELDEWWGLQEMKNRKRAITTKRGLLELLVIFLLALLFGLFLQRATAAEAKPAFVVQDEAAITCNSWGWRDNAFDIARSLDTDVIRINDIEWHPGCANRNDAPEAAVAAGFRAQLTLAGSVAYMKSKVMLHRNAVDSYAIWNEPDLGVWRCCQVKAFGNWGGMGDMADYRRVYKTMFRFIKRVDPRARVGIWETSPHGMKSYGGKKARRWIDRSLRRRRPLRADFVAVHPYFWSWSEHVDRRYYRALKGFKKSVRRWARERRLCMPTQKVRGRADKTRRRGCRPVPIYNTESAMPMMDGLAGDAVGVARLHRYCVKLKFKQCAQYMVLPALNETHSPGQWQTGLTDFKCQPTVTYYALRYIRTGERGVAPVKWPVCPGPIPQTKPLPPDWGTPAQPLPKPTPPPVPVIPPDDAPVLPDQPPEAIPPPPPLPPEVIEIPVPEPEPPVLELPGPPEPTPEVVVTEPTPIEATPSNPPPEPDPVPSEPAPEPATPVEATPERHEEPVPVDPPQEEPLP